jgi:ATP-binding cassette, subfamily B, bacterial PglK
MLNEPPKRPCDGPEKSLEPAENLSQALKIFFKALSPRCRRQGLFTLLLMLVGAGAEMLGISAVLVFLTVVTNPERLTSSRAWQVGQSFLHLEGSPILIATVAFILVMIVSGVIRLALIWAVNSIVVNAGLDFTAQAFEKVTRQKYNFYLNTGSDLIVSRMEKVHHSNNILQFGAQGFVSGVVALLIIIFLLTLNTSIALTLGIVLVGSYLGITILTRSILGRNSELLAAAHAERVKRIQEGVGGIRDILIDRSQGVFQADFEHCCDRIRRPQALNSVIPNAPRIVVEVIGMVGIAALALFLSARSGSLTAALPMLGGLAIGAQRLLPLLQQAYFGLSSFFANRQAVLEVAGMLAMTDHLTKADPGERRDLVSDIRFDAVSFAYVDELYVLRDVSFAIRKGERIGIIGTTGSGKSTLTDLLLGLLEPTNGRIMIDDAPLDPASLASWQAQVAHVPQAIYLSDDTLIGNIAFGVPRDGVDMALVESSARAAGIHDFIVGLPEQYQTRCGERGVRLSGGQRQRIGIARALYKRATVLVLDEATSALDNVTEKAVMQSISELSSDITIIMIAHRLTSLAECGRILQIESGHVTEVAPTSAGITKASARKR